MLATPSLFNQHLPPLADRVRPQSLSGFIGQSHLIDPDKILSKLLEKEQLFSLLFWGPPGTGKTTLARIIANNLNAETGIGSCGYGRVKTRAYDPLTYQLRAAIVSSVFRTRTSRGRTWFTVISWTSTSPAVQQSLTTTHWVSRFLASRAVPSTLRWVEIPPTSIVSVPRWRRTWSRLVP